MLVEVEAAETTNSTPRLGVYMNRRGIAFSGNLALFNIVDVLQLISSTKKGGILRLRAKDQTRLGEVVFDNGKIIDARSQTEQGVDAVFAILKIQFGEFEFTPQMISAPATIHVDTTSLLLDGLIMLDHSKKQKTVAVM